ncbi:hypothetical protein PsYK624_063410 [Phanerochaete sordida]|uniref:Uncharacterized protein n=1 Tax=Phanerochaete sordida TaxID=48140 RepID=A0A9P3GA86_9APHY|nr:hypothetical protein PsYK624_063410 [Phanerochaete sordida]
MGAEREKSRESTTSSVWFYKVSDVSAGDVSAYSGADKGCRMPKSRGKATGAPLREATAKCSACQYSVANGGRVARRADVGGPPYIIPQRHLGAPSDAHAWSNLSACLAQFSEGLSRGKWQRPAAPRRPWGPGAALRLPTWPPRRSEMPYQSGEGATHSVPRPAYSPTEVFLGRSGPGM